MIANLGNFSLWLALFFAALQFGVSYRKNNKSTLYLNKISVYSLLLFTLLSFLSLMYCYIVSDFSVSNVYLNSHTTKPLVYKISAVWGNHEGSMLLWILVLSIFNYFIFKLYNKNNIILITKTLETQAFVTIGFLLFTVLTSNPFEKIIPTPTNGLGFNPVLQDPALAIHPPLLYIGYVGFSAAFSFSISAMSVGNIEKVPWYNYMKPFVLAAWTFLTIGIAFGSIWAYYELGWGGWWFWDPVENASFMPWLLGTALVHSLVTVEKKKVLQKWVLLLAILAFLLSVIGTFLVRSGILTSVHTFALDPTRGIYILIFIAILGGYSLLIFAKNSKKFFDKNYISFMSREGSILVNNILMIVVCASVFLGTIYPLIIEALSNNKISVGEPYYNSTVIPIIIPAILIMGIVPLISWQKTSLITILKKTFPSIMLTFAITVTILWIYRSQSVLGFIGIILSGWIISNIVFTLFEQSKIKYGKNKFIKNSVPKFTKSMILAHIGVALLILGITGSSVWQKEKITRMKINDETIIHNYKVIFKEIKEVVGKNYVAIQGNFWIYNEKNNIITKLKPENRFYPITNNSTSEASIHTNILRDLYIVLGNGNEQDGWIVRVYYNPLVVWIWIGAFVIFLGGIFSINSNLKIVKRLSL